MMEPFEDEQERHELAFEKAAHAFAVYHDSKITAGVHVEGRYYFILDRKERLYSVRHASINPVSSDYLGDFDSLNDRLLPHSPSTKGEEVMVIRTVNAMPDEVVVALLKQGGIVDG
jgi:hypothetical protein